MLNAHHPAGEWCGAREVVAESSLRAIFLLIRKLWFVIYQILFRLRGKVDR